MVLDEAPKTRIGRIRQLYATPATPCPLLPTAAATPAQAVPWSSSASVGLGSLSPLTKSQPRRSSTYPLLSSSTPFEISAGLRKMFALRSGWPTCTASSRIAMTTLDDPVVMFQASGASTSASGFPWPCPVLCKCHCWPKKGSFGTPCLTIWPIISGSAHSTALSPNRRSTFRKISSAEAAGSQIKN